MNEYCFHQWLGQCQKMENAVTCGRECIDYRPIYIRDKKDLTDFEQRVKEGDTLALVILESIPTEVERQ